MSGPRVSTAQSGQAPLLAFAHPPRFPSTRYQGSKAKLAEWIWSVLEPLPFDSFLDAFGGTGCVSFMAKLHGREVTYNDALRWNYHVGLALIENDAVRLAEDTAAKLFDRQPSVIYPSFIRENFRDIYFTEEENAWLDVVVTNIRRHLDNIYAQALAYFALFQACIAKRPFNLFHRKNLYLRLADVRRNFGNKATWDTPFEELFLRYVREVNGAVFSNRRRNRAFNLDALEVPGSYDLVYIDTPYVSAAGVGVDYLDFYHFLEGLVCYDEWQSLIDYRTKHRRMKRRRHISQWADRTQIARCFAQVIERYRESTIAISYRADGVPPPTELASLVKRHKRRVVWKEVPFKYVLSKRDSAEGLLIGE